MQAANKAVKNRLRLCFPSPTYIDRVGDTETMLTPAVATAPVKVWNKAKDAGTRGVGESADPPTCFEEGR